MQPVHSFVTPGVYNFAPPMGSASSGHGYTALNRTPPGGNTPASSYGGWNPAAAGGTGHQSSYPDPESSAPRPSTAAYSPSLAFDPSELTMIQEEDADVEMPDAPRVGRSRGGNRRSG